MSRAPMCLSHEEVQKVIKDALDSHQSMVKMVISGEYKLPTFRTTDIPALDGRPSLILHKLGEISEEVKQRINEVFNGSTLYVFT